MKKHSYIGLDVHKESIAIVVGEGERHGEVRECGCGGGSLLALKRALRKLHKPGVELHCVYEAGLSRSHTNESKMSCRERERASLQFDRLKAY